MRVLLAGEFAHRTFCLLWAVSDGLIEAGRDILIHLYVTPQQNRHRRRLNSSVIHVGEKLVKLTVFYALYPIQLYAGLQRLNLLPLWPLLPNPFSKSLLRHTLPRIPSIWNGKSLFYWGMAAATCPATIFLGMQLFSVSILSKFEIYAVSTMPRPDNPDEASFEIMQEEEFVATQERVLNRLRRQISLRAEIRKDIASLKRTLMGIDLQFRNIWRKYVLGKRPSVGFPDVSSETSPEPIPEAQESTRRVHTPANLVLTGSTAVRSNSPLLTPISSEGESDFNETNPSSVRIRARAGSTSTLHMDVEFTTTDRVGGLVHTSSFASSPHPRSCIEMPQSGSTRRKLVIYRHVRLTRIGPYHRVTALSWHAVESLSLHTMATFTMLLRLPLDTLYMRCIARNFLSAHQTSGWLIQHVYPSNTWFGLGLHAGWSLMIQYSSKIALCSFLEFLTNMYGWHLTSRIALWLGKRWYGWGNL